MVQEVARRDILKKGLVGAAALALPARAFATEVVQAIPGGTSTDPNTPASAVPASPMDLAKYHRRVLEVAAREKDRLGSKLWRTDVVGIADFALPSWKPRFHFANLENGTVRSFLAAHGRGSDPSHSGWLQSFSNTPGSEATSRGAYLTCEWYKGKYGTSIRLVGLDPDNSLALDRAIVMHSAWYVEQAMVDKWGKIGRSEGCFAMGQADFNEALWHLSGGRLLFADRIGEG